MSGIQSETTLHCEKHRRPRRLCLSLSLYNRVKSPTYTSVHEGSGSIELNKCDEDLPCTFGIINAEWLHKAQTFPITPAFLLTKRTTAFGID